MHLKCEVPQQRRIRFQTSVAKSYSLVVKYQPVIKNHNPHQLNRFWNVFPTYYEGLKYLCSNHDTAQCAVVAFLRAGRSKEPGLIPCKFKSFVSYSIHTVFYPSSQPPTRLELGTRSWDVKRPERVTEYSLPSSVQGQNVWSYTSSHLYIFVAW